MPFIIALFFILGSAFFAIQIFGTTAVLWTVGILAAVWIVVHAAYWVFLEAMTNDDFFSITFASLLAAGLGWILSPLAFGYVVTIPLQWAGIALPFATMSVMYAFGGAVAFATLVIVWRWLNRRFATERAEANATALAKARADALAKSAKPK